jgi:hypothetical protein
MTGCVVDEVANETAKLGFVAANPSGADPVDVDAAVMPGSGGRECVEHHVVEIDRVATDRLVLVVTGESEEVVDDRGEPIDLTELAQAAVGVG